MRNKAYRRKQEASHYKKRLKFYRKFGNFGKSWYEAGDSYESKKIYLGKDANLNWSEKPKSVCSPLDFSDLSKLRWTKKLRRGDVKIKSLSSWSKRKSNRTLRHFLKTIPWCTPRRFHWPKRAKIYRPGYYEDEHL
jgi:hypothetical protein